MRDLHQLHVFTTVVQMGSFSGAAHHLNQSPSAISKYIGRLEHDVGVKLFNRSTHRLFLTEAGHLFFDRAQRLLVEIDIAVHDLQKWMVQPKGMLRIRMTPEVESAIRGRIWRFAGSQQETKLQLFVKSGPFDTASNEFDVAMSSESFRPDSNSDAITTELLQTHFAVCAAPTYLRERGIPDNPSELNQHGCLVYTEQPRWSFLQARRKYEVEIVPHLLSTDLRIILNAAIAGVGLARLPLPMCADALKAKTLKHIFPDKIEEPLTILAHFSRNNSQIDKIKSFVTSLRSGPKSS